TRALIGERILEYRFVSDLMVGEHRRRSDTAMRFEHPSLIERGHTPSGLAGWNCASAWMTVSDQITNELLTGAKMCFWRTCTSGANSTPTNPLLPYSDGFPIACAMSCWTSGR